MHPDQAARIVRALGHPQRVEVLRAIVNAQAAGEDRSPKRLAEELDLELSGLSYHVRALLAAELIELARTEPRRAVVERFYRPTPAATTALEAITALRNL